MRELQDKLQLSFAEMQGKVREQLHETVYKKKEICEKLDLSEEQLNLECLSAKTRDGMFNPIAQCRSLFKMCQLQRNHSMLMPNSDVSTDNPPSSGVD